MDSLPYRSHTAGVLADLERARGGDGVSSVRNPETWGDANKRFFSDFLFNKAVPALDPGVGLVSEFGERAGRGAFGDAAMLAPAMMLQALGGRGASKARGAFSLADGIPKQIRLPEGETIAAQPLEGIMRARENYMRSFNGVPTAVTSVRAAQPEFGARVAGAYDAMPDNLDAPGVRESYKALADETLGQYRALKNEGYTVGYMPRDEAGAFVDPYASNPALGYKDLRDNKHLKIFPTEGGFGSGEAAASSHPLLQPTGEMIDGKEAVYNDLFRFVHDAYGHNGPANAQFRAPGEDRAFGIHSTMFSPKALGAATSELRGQNSWVNYGPHGAHNRSASGADTIYADQKTGILPSWVQDASNVKTAPSSWPLVGLSPLSDDERQR